MGWLKAEESSGVRLVTGVVLLGGIGGDGLAGTRLAPPVAWVKSPANDLVQLIQPIRKTIHPPYVYDV